MPCECGPGCDCGCRGMSPSPGQGEALNNPSLEPRGEGSKKIILFIDATGGGVGPEQIAEFIANLANQADSAGLHDNATEMDGLLGKMAKVAQYEGFMNYWLANGRAFERAWKIKREKTPDDMRQDEYKSAHEAWMEVLEEYQAGLLGDHKEFLSKYAAMEVEEAGEGQTTTMSKSMTEWAKDMQAEAEKEGKTLGEMYSEWLESRKAEANGILMSKIASKISTGSAPGVAVYEAIEELTSPSQKVVLLAEIKSAADRLYKSAVEAGREDLAKEAQMLSGFWDALTSPFKGWLGNAWHKTKDWAKNLSASGGQSFKLMRSIQRKLPIVVRELEDIESVVATSSTNPAALSKALAPMMGDLEAYHKLVSPVVAMPPIPDPASPRYQSRVTGGVDASGYEMLIADLRNVINAVNSKNSLAYEKGKDLASSSMPQPQASPEYTRLQKIVENLLDNLHNILGRQFINPAAFSAALQLKIPKMIGNAVDKVREADDFVELSAEVRDKIADYIQRQLVNSGALNAPTINQRSRMEFSRFFEQQKMILIKEIEKVIRKQYDRKYQHRGSQQPRQST